MYSKQENYGKKSSEVYETSFIFQTGIPVQ